MADEIIHLTDREREMLRILAVSPGETVPRAALTGGGTVNERAVDVQINRLGARSSAIPPIRCSCRRCAASAIAWLHRPEPVVMSTLDTGLTLIRNASQRVSAANGWMGNAFKSWMPTGLYARALLIMIVPMVILQTVVAFVFMERHWNTVTRRLSAAVVQDIASLIDVYKTYPQDKDRAQLRRIAQRLQLVVDFLPVDDMPPPGPKPFFSLLDQTLSVQLGRQIGRPFWIDTVGRSNLVEIRIQLDDAVMRIFAQRSAAYASNSEIFIFWMLGTSSILLIVAVLFLRNQIRPILRLADAAESFGKGREAPNFRPRGAREVRRAAQAFLEMKARIERSIEQRTAMLAGVSHDLRTILTRFKLELALIGDGPGDRWRCARTSTKCPACSRTTWRSPAATRGEIAQPTDMAMALEELRSDAERQRPHRDGGVPRPAGRDRETGFVQALPRQPRLQRGAARRHDLDHRPSRSPLSDGDGRRRRTGHSRRNARGSVQAVPAARRCPQPGRGRHRTGPRDRPRYRTLAWRRHHARRQPDGRTAAAVRVPV